MGNLYQKMHFAGSNLSTDPKCPKCIYKISKNFRVEKSGEISRNLRFSRFFVPASKSDTHHGWDGRIRTDECGSQSPVPYRLATAHYGPEALSCLGNQIVYKCQLLTLKFSSTDEVSLSDEFTTEIKVLPRFMVSFSPPIPVITSSAVSFARLHFIGTYLPSEI